MSERAKKQPIILMVDDEPKILTELTAIISQAGYQSVSCNDSQSVREMLLKVTPDLIISDINLAGENGLLLCEEIKEQPQFEDMPVIILSGADLPDIVRRSYEAGGNYYLRKPYDPNVLLDIIDRALWMPHLVATRVRKPKMSTTKVSQNNADAVFQQTGNRF